jgi:DNA-binding FadR family transcriptional regulator
MPEERKGAVVLDLPPTGPRKLHGRIAHLLGTRIIGGAHKPGDILPNEEQLASDLSVSRTALREAIRMLLAKGLIESRPRTGTRITPRARWNMLDPDELAWHLEADPNDNFITNLFEIRRIVEPSAAALAAERRSRADLAAMTQALERLQGIVHAEAEGLIADIAFHRAILASTHNEQLTAFGSVIDVTLRWSLNMKFDTGQHRQRNPIVEHHDVYGAIESRDAEAARAYMAALVTNALKDTRLALQGKLGKTIR